MNIKWNEYTWYSKWASLVFFILFFPVLTFYIGTQYQKTVSMFASGADNQPKIITQSPVNTTTIESAENLATTTISGNPLNVKVSSCENYDEQTCFGSGASPVQISDSNLKAYSLTSTATEARFGIVIIDAGPEGDYYEILSFDTGTHPYTNEEYDDYIKKIGTMYNILNLNVLDLGESYYMCADGTTFTLLPSHDMKNLNLVSASSTDRFLNTVVKVSAEKSNTYIGENIRLVGIGETITITLKNSSSTLACHPLPRPGQAPLNFGDAQ